ncbi:hypothetical protein NLG97_g1358 [Lecanicillium saksenae]|uniref:Uncharacterized protein n=1 Tax=Lecanicillium saksenae TaxID=468837 RepID=A0ACC1R5Q5_9HYPO|nr:hypothetical protein NLG97_g1358 [Lecanicillium saksenae]
MSQQPSEKPEVAPAVQETQDANNELPPQDRGRKAYLFLFAVSILEITTWGWSYCYGVFRDYFFQHEPFKGQQLVSVGGMLANGCLQLTLPVVIYLLNSRPKYRRPTMWAGAFICGISVIIGAFMTNVAGLIIFLGATYGIGAGMIYGPAMHYLAHWFVAKKSLAYGIICGVGAAGGAALPPVYTVLLNRWGAKVSLIAIGIATILVTSLALCFVHPRTPVQSAPKPSLADFRFFRQPIFVIFFASTVIQALAHFAPSAYLPSIGRDMGLNTTEGALLISFLNLAQAIGQPLIGLLTDYRQSVFLSFSICTAGGSLCALLIWGFARHFWSLLLFALAYGCTAGGFAVLRPRFAQVVLRQDALKHESSEAVSSDSTSEEEHDRILGQETFIFGILTASRGISVTASGFITAALVDTKSTDLSGYGLGTKWRKVIIFTGATMLLSLTGVFGRFLCVAHYDEENDSATYRK